MLIVSDDLPEELVRVIEFLNGQMNPAEILGVEVPQYSGGRAECRSSCEHRGSDAPSGRPEALGTVWSRESFQEEAGHRSGALWPPPSIGSSPCGIPWWRLSWSEGVTPGGGRWLPIKP